MPNNSVMPQLVPTRLRDDRGFLLVEVLVSAMLLVVASLAIMTAIDRSDALAGNQQKRTIGANVAQSELERIRSLPIEDVANLRSGSSGKRTVTLNGVNYTVNSDARWLTDGKDTVDCTASNGGLDYLKVTTSVSWPSMGNAKPARLTTIVSPSNRSTSDGNGSLSVSIVNAAGVGIANLPVSLTGAEPYADQTDAQGCVAWGDLDASSSWNLKFAIPGYVDANGNPDVDDTIALAGGATTVRQYQYDKAGYITARFRTRITAGNDIPANAEDFSIENSQMSSARTATFGTTQVWDSQTASPTVRLFPFQSSPYTVYAGQCTAAKPNPASSNPQAPNYVNVSGAQNQGVFVQMPAMQITVNDRFGNRVPAGVDVKVTDSCGNAHIRQTNSNGMIDGGDAAFPYFTSGSICAAYGGRRVIVNGIGNTDFTRATTRTIQTTSSGSSC